jgi:hypothetical protein
VSNQTSSATRQMSGSRAAVAGVALALATAVPAAADPGSSRPVPGSVVSTDVSCATFDRPLTMTSGRGRLVTLTDSFTGESEGRAIIRRYTYIVRGGPQSGETITTTYPGPNRNLVECAVLSGPVYYTLSVLWR